MVLGSQVDVDLVTVACSVSDRGGAPVRKLKRKDFNLTDNGESREITNFWQESDLPLTVALVADVSGSQAGFIKSHRDAIAQFLKQVIGPRDRAMILETYWNGAPPQGSALPRLAARPCAVRAVPAGSALRRAAPAGYLTENYVKYT